MAPERARQVALTEGAVTCSSRSPAVPTNQTSRLYRKTDGQSPYPRGRALLHLICWQILDFGQDRLQEAGHTIDASNLPSVEAGTNVPVAAFSLGNDSDEKSNGSIGTD